jgi:Fe-S cluster assembly ATP-binding protein
LGFLIITHYAKLLHYLQPREVLVMIDGRIVKKGRLPLVKQIERFGYEKLFNPAGKLK